MDTVRVLRIIEYVGDRDVVEDQINQSLHGSNILRKGKLTINVATIGEFPEILSHSHQEPIEPLYNKAHLTGSEEGDDSL